MVDQINEVKQKNDIVDIVGQYVSLKKSGKNYKGNCPFHSEKTASFMVSPELQIYKCFGCGAGGDIFSFIEKMEGLEFRDALEKLAERVGITLEKGNFDNATQQKKIAYEINHITAEIYHKILLSHASGKTAIEYLKKSRGLKKETIEKFKIGAAPNGWDVLYKTLTKRGYKNEDLLMSGVIVQKKSGEGYIDKFRNRVVFPLVNYDGKIVGFTARALEPKQEPKYLNTSETPVFHKNEYLYGLDKAKAEIKKKGVVFVEGQMDVISAHQAQLNNVVASSGTALTQQQLNLISRYTTDITFCFDSDNAGLAAMQRAIEMAEKQNFNISAIAIPAPFKDLDELIKKDIEKARELINKPIPVYDYLVSTTIKKYPKKSPVGKKRIIEELRHTMLGITNEVIFQHYVKILSEELEVSENAILITLGKNTTGNYKKQNIQKNPEIEPEQSTLHDYLISLVLRAQLDTGRDILYKLQEVDFPNDKLQKILKKLKESFDEFSTNPSVFVESVDGEIKKTLAELYVADIGDIEDVDKELLHTFARVKKETLKKLQKKLTAEIRSAELERNTEKVKELLQEFEKVSKEYLTYA